MRQQLQEESQAAHDDEAETQEVWIPDCGTEQNGFLIKDLRTERMREVIARGQEGTGVALRDSSLGKWVDGGTHQLRNGLREEEEQVWEEGAGVKSGQAEIGEGQG